MTDFRYRGPDTASLPRARPAVARRRWEGHSGPAGENARDDRARGHPPKESGARTQVYVKGSVEKSAKRDELGRVDRRGVLKVQL
jgi:hypothetical protein